MNKDHHWVGEEPDPDKFFGFIYMIRDETIGKSYIGKKTYFFSKQGVYGCKSKVFDRSSDKWKDKCWKSSDWKTYKGSCKELTKHLKENPDNNYTYTILRQCCSKGQLTYYECYYLWKYDVLTEVLADGVRAFFNSAIGAVRFIPKL